MSAYISQKNSTDHDTNGSGIFLRAAMTALIMFTLPSCSKIFMPYENDFACKNTDHGKCIHPEEAYNESVARSGGAADFSALPAENAAQAGLPGGSDAVVSQVRRVRSKDDPVRFAVGQPLPESHTPYTSYQTAVYKQITGMLEAPTPPVMQAATQVRTLILPYADRNRPDRLYMPRFVYSVVSGPRWVLGQYKTRAAANQLPAAFDQGASVPLRALPNGEGGPATPASVNNPGQPSAPETARKQSTAAAKTALDQALADNGLAALLESQSMGGAGQ